MNKFAADRWHILCIRLPTNGLQPAVAEAETVETPMLTMLDGWQTDHKAPAATTLGEEKSSCLVRIAPRSLNATDDQTAALTRLLSASEHSRMEALQSPRARQEFILSRATLRRLLGEMLAREGRDLEFSYGPNGKPELPGEPIAFNVSHTDGFAAFGFSTDGKVGIDVERRRPDLQVQEIAHAALTEEETQILFSECAGDKEAAVLRLWTAKEALLKATGGTIADVRGICEESGLSLDDCRLIMSGRPFCLRWHYGWLRNLHLGAAFVATLAVCTDAANVELQFI